MQITPLAFHDFAENTTGFSGCVPQLQEDYNNFLLMIRRTGLLKTRTIWYNNTKIDKLVQSTEAVTAL